MFAGLPQLPCRKCAISPPMSIKRTPDMQALLAFYIEAGVDALLDETPVNRFVADGPQPRNPPAPVDDPELEPTETRPPLNRTGENAPRLRSRALPANLEAPPTPDAAIMAARDAARGAMSLDALRSILERFEGCGLHLTAKRLVFADGNPQANVMFVGEAPGREEDIEGLPFVGRSGQLLDRMMAAIGLDRTRAYIANVIPWRPPGNRTPTPQESQIC